jgi:steroid delta-isomerase-like uncharacterized protein
MDHTDAMRRIYERINTGDVPGLGDLLADDLVEHEVIPGVTPDKEGVLAFFGMLLTAFPDLRMNPDDILVDGDKAVARVTMTGTNQGEFMGMPATGRAVDVQIIDIMRFDGDGLVAEHWGVIDAMAMMQQLGAIPEAGPAA